MSELKNTVNLVMGDWSHDGHEKTETVTIRCNLDRKELERAYKAGVKKTKVKFDDDVASDYDDNRISKEIVAQLVPYGFKIEEYSEDEDEDTEEGYSLWTDGYVLAWLFMAKVGDPSIEYEIVENDSINIGGYGLFH